MNNRYSKFKESKRKYIYAYRSLLAVFAIFAIIICFVLNMGSFFDPTHIRRLNVGAENIGKLVPADPKKHTIPENNGLYKDELYFIEQKENDSSASELPDEKTVQGEYPIISLDMSGKTSNGEILINDTDSNIDIDVSHFLSLDYPVSLQNDDISRISAESEPLVLIIHTHATECYTEEGVSSYDNDTSFRSSDPEKNMIAVGKVFSDTLKRCGIPTIHCQLLHDEDSYNASYTNSLESVKYYLEKYPSIKYVFDLHRDAIIRDNGDLIKTEHTIGGSTCAQVMSVVGTNALGADHPNWEDNMNLAIKLQAALNSNYNGFTRPINTRGASFNQQYAPGSLLFEIGSCGNTLNEAKRAAVYLGETLSQLITQEG